MKRHGFAIGMWLFVVAVVLLAVFVVRPAADRSDARGRRSGAAWARENNATAEECALRGDLESPPWARGCIDAAVASGGS